MQEFDFIETPENVRLQRRLAGIGTRFIAGLMDSLMILLIYLVLFLVLLVVLWSTTGRMDSLGDLSGTLVVAVLILVAFAIYWGYFVFFELRTNGQSPGKKSQRIRVVKDGGMAVTFTDVAIRNLLRVVDGFGGYLVAGICMFVTEKAQRLGDLAAGTVVVSEAVSDYTARSDKRKAGIDWEDETSAAALRATGLSPEEYRVLYNYNARREQLTHEARVRLLAKLVVPILQRHGLTTQNLPSQTLERELDALLLRAHSQEDDASGGRGKGQGAP